jgi:ATP-binding cassette subfamily C protein
LPYINFLNYNSADIFVNLTTGLSIFRSSLQNLIDISKEILLILVIIIAMIYADPASFVLISLVSFIVVCFYFSFKKSFKDKGILAQNYRKNFYMILSNAFGLFKVSKIFSVQKYLENNFNDTLDKEQSIVVYQEFFTKLPKLFLELVSVIIILFIIQLFFSQGKNFTLLIPLIGFYTAAIIKVVPSFNSIISMSAQLKYNSAAIDVIFDEFNKFKLLKNYTVEDNLKKKLSFDHNIVIKDISFSYINENSILKNFSCEIKKGEFVAITGKSGSGKTTLIDILIGILVPVQGGGIIVDNKINILKKNDLLNLAYVPQENFIFDDTLKNNITFWKEAVDDNQIIEIIKDVQLLEFYNESKEGLNTLLGERGSKLSGGQKQRLGIARALYLKPQILVLDEATNALDSYTQSNLLNCLSKKKPELTVIFISHNQEVIEFCDRNINLDFLKQRI